MKILKTLCLLAFAAVMPAMLTSCDDDDEPSSASSSCDDDDKPSSSASSSYSGPYFGLRDCGKVISSIRGLGIFDDKPLSFVYDGSGRVIEVKGYDETVSYDYNSQRGEVVTKYNGNEIISFDADAKGRFNSLTRWDCWDIWDKFAYKFKYNSDGNVISVVETHSELVDGKWTNSWCGTYTFIWDGDLLTSVRWTTIDEDGSTSDYEVKITYSDVDNKYRTPLYGLSTMPFRDDLYPNELSIAPAKLPKKIDYYVQGKWEIVYACRYTLDDEGFLESESIGFLVGGEDFVDVRYTYADKEF